MNKIADSSVIQIPNIQQQVSSTILPWCVEAVHLAINTFKSNYFGSLHFTKSLTAESGSVDTLACKIPYTVWVAYKKLLKNLDYTMDWLFNGSHMSRYTQHMAQIGFHTQYAVLLSFFNKLLLVVCFFQ